MLPDAVQVNGQKSLSAMTYAEYLDSAVWQRLRAQALERAGWRCVICNTAKTLEVHHRAYPERGTERPADLVVLCAVCHALFHERMKLVK